MIIDSILDRREGERNGSPYIPKDFYLDMLDRGYYGARISRAMDRGTEDDVRRELCRYIDFCAYGEPDIKRYVLSRNWLV